MSFKQKGFTLVELMITVTILSSLLLLASFTYQQLAQRWQTDLDGFSEHQVFGRHLNIFYSTLQSIQPYIVRKNEDESNDVGFVFEGNENRLLSVSKFGLMQQKYPEIFRLIVEKNENDKFRLIYQARSTQGILLKYAEQEILFEYEIELFDDFDEIKFNYFGWDSIVQKSESKKDNINGTWRNKYSGLEHQQLPEIIAVKLVKGDKDLLFTIELDKNTLRYLTPYLSLP